MATRFYFHRSGVTGGFAPTPQGAWDDTVTITRARLGPQKDTLTSSTQQRAETSTDTAWDVLIGQFVSDALDTAQTISGTFDLCIQCFETAADADMHLHVHVWVSQGSTSTPRGTLLTDYIDTSEFATAETGLAIVQQTLSAVSAQVGDRIVVEIGFQAQNATATSKSGRIRHGGHDATDLTHGDTNDEDPSWCEFGTSIQDAETRVDWQQKWYLGGSGQAATAIPPLIRGAWDVTTSVTLTGANALKAATPGVASGQIQLSMTTTAADTDRLLKVFVGPPLNAGTIPAALFRIIGLTLENATDQDIVWAVCLYLMKPNGDVRAILVDLTADPDADNEWPITTAAGRQSDEFSLSSQAISQDDRLVLEVGGRQLGTPAASGNITIRQGGTGGDAAVGDTDTTKPTWFGVTPTATPARNQGVIAFF